MICTSLITAIILLIKLYMWWSWQPEESERRHYQTHDAERVCRLRPFFLSNDQTSSAPALLRGKVFLAQCDHRVFSWCGPLSSLAFIGAPRGRLQGPLRSLGSEAVGFLPLTPVNRLHKFYLPISKSAMLFVLLSSQPLLLLLVVEPLISLTNTHSSHTDASSRHLASL